MVRKRKVIRGVRNRERVIQDVFFENITDLHRPLVSWYLARGYRVFVFDFSYDLKRIPWLRSMINRGVVRRVYVHPYSPADSLAIDATEWLYPRYARHPLVRMLGGIYGAKEVGPVFKKALLDDVYRNVFVCMFLKWHMQTEGRTSRVTFVPERFGILDPVLRAWPRYPGDALETVQISAGPRLWSSLVRDFDKVLRMVWLSLGGIAILGWVWLVNILRPAGHGRQARKAYDHVYAIDQPFQAKFSGPRRFDFLLDGVCLTKENTAFLVHWSAEGAWMQEARAAGYQVIARRMFSGPGGYWRYPTRTVRVGPLAWTLIAIACLVRAPGWLLRCAACGVGVILGNANVLEYLACANYIYTNQDGLVQRWLNALIRQRGGQSWCFALSIGGGYLRGNRRGFLDWADRHRLWAYQNADALVGPSRRWIEFQRQHPQTVKVYHNVGNIWSELVSESSASGRGLGLRPAWANGRVGGRKIIACFDTSFVEARNSPSTYTDAIVWYRDLLRLLEERPDLLMVIKPSKAVSWFTDERGQWWDVLGERVVELWQRLQAHPRVHFAGHDADPASIVAHSNLTVTYAFSSVSAEALGARKRAIWYEPGERWRQALYGRDPLLTAHGYEELRALVGKLLDEVSDEEYNRFLQTRVRGLVEDFLDQKGLSRFRTLLAQAAQLSRTVR